jgi:four helix bundle protein
MPYKFEKLEIYQLALDYLDQMYTVAQQLPPKEDHNLHSQMIRAATSVVLNIAEGSTGQSNAEQARFLGMALRSLVETVACQQIILRRNYLSTTQMGPVYQQSEKLFAKAQAMRKTLIQRNQQTSR